MSRYEFDREKAYKLVAILDKEGKSKAEIKCFYADRLNCIAVNLRYDKNPVYGTTDAFRMKMNFVRKADGMPVLRKLHTSVVHEVEKTEKGLKIHTENSVYILEEAEVKELLPSLEETRLIELYLSMEEDAHFAAGFYYDTDKKAHKLVEYVHVVELASMIFGIAYWIRMSLIIRKDQEG